MTIRVFKKWCVASLLLSAGGLTQAQETPPAGCEEALPAPVRTGGMPLNEALDKRQTIRRMDKTRELDAERLSGLLWAANGFNRPAKRTAPTARNVQELELIVLLPSGGYSYDARKNRLVRLTEENLLPVAGSFGVAEILIVADADKCIDVPLTHVDSGFIGQNIYLYCASEGMAAVFRGAVDRDSIHKKLGLGEKQIITYTVSVGYPEKKADAGFSAESGASPGN